MFGAFVETTCEQAHKRNLGCFECLQIHGRLRRNHTSTSKKLVFADALPGVALVRMDYLVLKLIKHLVLR